MLKLDSSHSPLERAYRWEHERADALYMTQPLGGGAVDTFSWARTLDESRRMAAHLQSLGFERGSRIAILSKNCAHFIMSDLAIWMAGYASVALYPTLTADTVEYVLQHSGAKLLFVGKLDDWESMKPGVPEALPCIAYPLSPPTDYPGWKDIVAKTEPLEGTPTRELDEMALLCYTSGSTGRPKGVITTFGNMTAAAQGVEAHFAMTPEERQISYLPLAHSFERAVVEAGSLHNGSQIFFAESLDTFAEDLRRARPTLFHSVPRLWLKFHQGVLRKMPQKKLDRLLRIPIVSGLVKRKILKALGLDAARLAVSGSAPIPPELIQWYRDLGLELLEGYAMSENFAYSHVSLPGRTRVGYVGDPMPGVECRISEEGEIQVKSLANMPGYFENEAATAEAFTEDGFLRTGDRGVVDEEGRLRITGRVKELFKTSKGKYVAPVPIENLLNASTSVEQSCVTGSGHPMPHAVVMLPEELAKELEDGSTREQVSRTLGELLERVNAQVESFERLAFIAVAREPWLIENGFLTPTMKIKRSAIEAAYAPLADAWYERREKVVWED
jgi:long-chain acyl-CoA synthetase